MHRRTRQRVGTWMVGVLLLAQWLVAAYACPAATRALAADAVVAQPGEVGCHSSPPAAMDPANPLLCKGHCDADRQAPAHAAAGDAPAPGAAPLWFTVPALDLSDGAVRPAALWCAPRSGAPPGWPPLHLSLGVLRN